MLTTKWDTLQFIINNIVFNPYDQDVKSKFIVWLNLFNETKMQNEQTRGKKH